MYWYSSSCYWWTFRRRRSSARRTRSSICGTELHQLRIRLLHTHIGIMRYFHIGLKGKTKNGMRLLGTVFRLPVRNVCCSRTAVDLKHQHSNPLTFSLTQTNAGKWQKNKLMPNMPFDAVLVASRVMVAKEASTALEVKHLIVKTPGLNFESEHLWESSYDGEAGGVLTVQSELGEPIHKIANRGTWCSSARIFIVSLKYFTRITVHQTQVHDCGETSIDDTSELRERPNRSARSSF